MMMNVCETAPLFESSKVISFPAGMMKLDGSYMNSTIFTFRSVDGPLAPQAVMTSERNIKTKPSIDNFFTLFSLFMESNHQFTGKKLSLPIVQSNDFRIIPYIFSTREKEF
jgi:hypothetical protein